MKCFEILALWKVLQRQTPLGLILSTYSQLLQGLAQLLPPSHLLPSILPSTLMVRATQKTQQLLRIATPLPSLHVNYT